MPISRHSFLRTSAILFATGLIALLVIVGATVWLAERSVAISDDINSARVARAATVNLRNALQNAESAQRGFLLTSDGRYLDPYETQQGLIPSHITNMRVVVVPQFLSSEAMDALEETVRGKLANMDETIVLAREDRLTESHVIMRTDQGKALMDEALARFNNLIDQADEQIFSGLGVQNRNFTALRFVAVIGGLVIILVAAGSIWTASTYTRELTRARAEVEALNVGLEARVRERTQDLIRANEEVQRFAYIVTHDLRAPLVNIMGFTSELDTTMKSIQDYVLADAPDAHKVKEARLAAAEDLPEAIGFIRSSTRKMDGLINAILKISRDGRRPLRPERIDLREMLEATLGSVQHQIAEGDGEAELDIGVGAIVSDRMSLEQIIGNLLDNAVKYRANDRPLRIRISARRSGAGMVTIAVEDNGRGIAAQDHERVFDLFRRAGTQDKPGEGIGLAHVRTLARNLGGDIEIESEFGRGSTFSLVVPADLKSVIRSESA